MPSLLDDNYQGKFRECAWTAMLHFTDPPQKDWQLLNPELSELSGMTILLLIIPYQLNNGNLMWLCWEVTPQKLSFLYMSSRDTLVLKESSGSPQWGTLPPDPISRRQARSTHGRLNSFWVAWKEGYLGTFSRENGWLTTGSILTLFSSVFVSLNL